MASSNSDQVLEKEADQDHFYTSDTEQLTQQTVHCEVCMDWGSSEYMILCENQDDNSVGCLGGIHIYCHKEMLDYIVQSEISYEEAIGSIHWRCRKCIDHQYDTPQQVHQRVIQPQIKNIFRIWAQHLVLNCHDVNHDPVRAKLIQAVNAKRKQPGREQVFGTIKPNYQKMKDFVCSKYNCSASSQGSESSKVKSMDSFAVIASSSSDYRRPSQDEQQDSSVRPVSNETNKNNETMQRDEDQSAVTKNQLKQGPTADKGIRSLPQPQIQFKKPSSVKRPRQDNDSENQGNTSNAKPVGDAQGVTAKGSSQLDRPTTTLHTTKRPKLAQINQENNDQLINSQTQQNKGIIRKPQPQEPFQRDVPPRPRPANTPPHPQRSNQSYFGLPQASLKAQNLQNLSSTRKESQEESVQLPRLSSRDLSDHQNMMASSGAAIGIYKQKRVNLARSYSGQGQKDGPCIFNLRLKLATKEELTDEAQKPIERCPIPEDAKEMFIVDVLANGDQESTVINQAATTLLRSCWNSSDGCIPLKCILFTGPKDQQNKDQISQLRQVYSELSVSDIKAKQNAPLQLIPALRSTLGDPLLHQSNSHAIAWLKQQLVNPVEYYMLPSDPGTTQRIWYLDVDEHCWAILLPKQSGDNRIYTLFVQKPSLLYCTQDYKHHLVPSSGISTTPPLNEFGVPIYLQPENKQVKDQAQEVKAKAKVRFPEHQLDLVIGPSSAYNRESYLQGKLKDKYVIDQGKVEEGKRLLRLAQERRMYLRGLHTEMKSRQGSHNGDAEQGGAEGGQQLGRRDRSSSSGGAASARGTSQPQEYRGHSGTDSKVDGKQIDGQVYKTSGGEHSARQTSQAQQKVGVGQAQQKQMVGARPHEAPSSKGSSSQIINETDQSTGASSVSQVHGQDLKHPQSTVQQHLSNGPHKQPKPTVSSPGTALSTLNKPNAPQAQQEVGNPSTRPGHNQARGGVKSAEHGAVQNTPTTSTGHIKVHTPMKPPQLMRAYQLRGMEQPVNVLDTFVARQKRAFCSYRRVMELSSKCCGSLEGLRIGVVADQDENDNPLVQWSGVLKQLAKLGAEICGVFSLEDVDVVCLSSKVLQDGLEYRNISSSPSSAKYRAVNILLSDILLLKDQSALDALAVERTLSIRWFAQSLAEGKLYGNGDDIAIFTDKHYLLSLKTVSDLIKLEQLLVDLHALQKRVVAAAAPPSPLQGTQLPHLKPHPPAFLMVRQDEYDAAIKVLHDPSLPSRQKQINNDKVQLLNRLKDARLLHFTASVHLSSNRTQINPPVLVRDSVKMAYNMARSKAVVGQGYGGPMSARLVILMAGEQYRNQACQQSSILYGNIELVVTFLGLLASDRRGMVNVGGGRHGGMVAK